jgi:sarcosine oxidase subunit beta
MFVRKAAPTGPSGSSGSAGAAHRLRADSWAFYGRLVEDGTLEFSRIGGLYPAEGADGLDRLGAAAGTLGEHGVRTELLDAAELERFGLEPDGLVGGLHVPDEGYLDPAGVVQFLLGEARAAGVRVETGTAVTDVLVGDGEASRGSGAGGGAASEGVVGVVAGGERVPASGVVNAAGPWAPSVDAMAGVDLPLRHNRGPILVLDHGTDPPLPFVEFEDGHYVRGEGRRQVFAGRYGAGYDAAGRLDPDAARSVEESFRLAVGERLGRHLPGLVDAGVAADWVGLRTVTPDGRPFVGGTALDGYYVATGMNGLGVTLAPAVGEHLASVVVADGRWTASPDRPPDAAVRAYLSPSRLR